MTLVYKALLAFHSVIRKALAVIDGIYCSILCDYDMLKLGYTVKEILYFHFICPDEMKDVAFAFTSCEYDRLTSEDLDLDVRNAIAYNMSSEINNFKCRIPELQRHLKGCDITLTLEDDKIVVNTKTAHIRSPNLHLKGDDSVEIDFIVARLKMLNMAQGLDRVGSSGFASMVEFEFKKDPAIVEVLKRAEHDTIIMEKLNCDEDFSFRSNHSGVWLFKAHTYTLLIDMNVPARNIYGEVV